MVPLVHLIQTGFHIVAQIIEPKLVIGRVGDVSTISGFFVCLRLLWIDNARCQPQSRINLAHPIGIAAGQIVVHGHDMHALACQSVQVSWECGDQSLAFTRLHLGDIALMQENATHQLRVEGAQTQGPACAFPAVCKGFGQNRIKALAICNSLF